MVAAENTQNDASEVHGPAECGQITEKATLTSGGTASTLNSEEAAATCNLIHEATSRAPDEEKKMDQTKAKAALNSDGESGVSITPRAKDEIQLIGRRIEVTSTIQGVRTTALWDSGSQVSLVSRTWLDENLQHDKIRIQSVVDLISHRLTLEGVRRTEIPYLGYVSLTFKLGCEEKTKEVSAPFLVTKKELKTPIVGSNLIEHVVGEGSARASLAQFGLAPSEISAVAALLVRQADCEPVSTVRTARQNVLLIPAKSSQAVDCVMMPVDAAEDCTVLFEPRADWALLYPNLKLHASVVDLKKGRNTKVNIRVSNQGETEVFLDNNCEFGAIYELQYVYTPEIACFEFDAECTNDRVENPVTVASTEADEEKKFEDLKKEEVNEESQRFYEALRTMELPELAVADQLSMKNMLWAERAAFSLHPDDIGHAPELQLHLTTTDEIPVAKNYNSIPKPLYAEVKQHVQNMLTRGWITKSKSPWSSPVVIAKKKDGGIRFCCDYRLLNRKTVADKHPLPRVQEALDDLVGSNLFTVVDFSRAYYQGFLTPDSRAKTAFVTPWGFFEWVRIPFGLTNAVAAFQRFMEETLEEVRGEFALPYLDDTIIYSKVVSEHIDHIRQVLRKFKERGLKLNIDKCEIAKSQVRYLGRIVSAQGYRMDNRNVEAVRALVDRKFETVGDVRRLIGLLSFHRRHVQDFAKLARPLTDALQGDGEGPSGVVPSRKLIRWEAEHQAALEVLVQYVTNPPILAYADFTKEFFVHTDASGQGLGGILYQVQDDKTRVIAYASRTLRNSEVNYHSGKLEFLAMKWSVCDAFKCYLSYADMFKVFTDNNPLLYVMTKPKTDVTMQRWVSELAEFNFTIHYRAGKVNRDADCLSRLPLEIDVYTSLCGESVTRDAFQTLVASLQVLDGEELATPWRPTVEVLAGAVNLETVINMKEDQEADDYIRPVLVKLREGKTLNNRKSKVKLPQATTTLLRGGCDKLYLDEDGVLWRKTRMHTQLVLPLKHFT